MKFQILIFINFILFIQAYKYEDLYFYKTVRRNLKTCNLEKRAVTCDLVQVNFTALDLKTLYINETEFNRFDFRKIGDFETKGVKLKLFEVPGKTHKAYLTVIHTNDRIFGNFEVDGAKYTIISIYGKTQILKKWHTDFFAQSTPKPGSRYLQRETGASGV